VIDLGSFTEAALLDLYPAGAAQPAPGLDLDIAAGKGYLAAPAPELGGLLEFDLTSTSNPPTPPPFLFAADVYYPLQNGIATGVQEASVTNYTGDPRRGIVISRSDPTGFRNRADRVTGIDLGSGLKNLIGTDKQTTSIAIVPPRASDDPNQLFLFRIKVDYATNTSRIGVRQLVLQ